MKKYFYSLIVICCPFWLISQTNYYVATTGNDANAGTFNAPWRTFEKAANNATPGSTVFFRVGTYEKAWLQVSGTANNYITFKNYGCEQVIIDGGSTNTNTTLVGIENKSYIRIQGLHFQNAIGNFSSAIYIIDGSHHIEIIDNKVSNIHFDIDPTATVNSSRNSTPVVVYNQNPNQSCNNILIKNNEIFNCRTGFSEALSLGGNVEQFEISGNVVHDITNIGIDVTGGYGVSPNPANDFARNGVVKENVAYNCVSSYAVSAGIYVDGGQDVIVERNISYQNGRGFEIGAEEQGHETKNVILRNNLSYRNLEAGIGIGGYDFPNTGKVTNCQILNNSFYDNNTRDINFEGELLIEYTENCTIENNIFYAKNTPNFLLVARLNSQNITLNYNCYFHESGNNAVKIDWEGTVYTGFTNYQNGTSQDLQAQFADPLFVQPNSGVLQLQAGSPVIDAGNPSFVLGATETDFIGWNRVLNSRVDQGAFEGIMLQCPKDLDLSNNVLGPVYQVSEQITTNGLIKVGAEVTMQANTIQLNPNFHALAGSNFTAKIAPCVVNNLQESAVTTEPFRLRNDKVSAEKMVITVYPNPIPAYAIVELELPADGWIQLSLYNSKGELVRQLMNSTNQTKGKHQFNFTVNQLENGLYFLSIKGTNVHQTKKIIIQR